MMYAPKCWKYERDCFALWEDGKCGILKSNYRDGKCPFYRPASEVDRRQIEAECKAYAEMKGEDYVG